MHPLSLSALVLALVLPAQSFSGVLEDSDPVWEGARHYDRYTVTVQERQQVTVRMTSDEFDTYLIVQTPDGQTYTNDDHESTSVSLVEFLAGAAGEVTVMAAGFGMDDGGAYDVEVTLGGIAEVETISGRLDPTDSEALKGEYYDTHTIEVADDQPFTIELNCFGFDGYLVARAPDGETWRNDDAEDASRSRIGPLRGAGSWTVYVTTSYSGQVGAYDLRIIRVP